MSSKYGVSFADKIAILEAKSKRLRQHDRHTLDVLMLTGSECREQIERLVLASEEILRVIDGTLSKEMKTAMKSVRHSAVSMRCVVNNYLNLARLGNRRLVIRPTLIDPIRDVLEPLLADYADLLMDHEQTCQIKNSRPGILIWADRMLLTNVYDNLIHNALELGTRGGTIIFTIMERGRVDEFSVWYSGQGLDSRYLEFLGERLTYGVGDVVRRDAEIGVYLAGKIIEAHGGRLWAETQPNAWANFIFTLPKREVAVRERSKDTNDYCFSACQ